MAAIYTPIRIPENVMQKIEEEMKKQSSKNKSRTIIAIIKKQLKIKN
jgi:hypothetical protein